MKNTLLNLLHTGNLWTDFKLTDFSQGFYLRFDADLLHVDNLNLIAAASFSSLLTMFLVGYVNLSDTQDAQPEELANWLYPDVNKTRFSDYDRYTKRCFDVLFSLAVIILGMPIFILILLLVKLTSKGPVFFLQLRTGQWGEKFLIVKFRTMHADAHKYGLKHSLGANDPRLTSIGNLLRRSRLDELPQFFNVLKGDMSVVGPRPLYKHDADMLLSAAEQRYRTLLSVKPGITSIGQIKVGYASTFTENVTRLRYDLLYLRSYSLIKDLYLIALTIHVVVLGKGR
jgi:lipopolysaccharide/colanic/teichoic acid biosynthesis glycosyltransferase